MWLWRLSPIWLPGSLWRVHGTNPSLTQSCSKEDWKFVSLWKGKSSWTLRVLQMGSWPQKQRWEHLTFAVERGGGWERVVAFIPSPWAHSKVKSHLNTCINFNEMTYDENLKAWCCLPRRLSSGAAAAWLQGKGVWLVLTPIALLFTAEKRWLPSHKGKAEILMLSIRNWRKELFYHTWWMVKWEGSYHLQLWSWIPALLLTLSRPACGRCWPMAESLQKSQICWSMPITNIHDLIVTTGPWFKR